MKHLVGMEAEFTQRIAMAEAKDKERLDELKAQVQELSAQELDTDLSAKFLYLIGALHLEAEGRAPNSLRRIRTICENAAREDPEYHKLRFLHPGFHDAVGKWPKAVDMLLALGFTHETTYEGTEYLALSGPLDEARLDIVRRALDADDTKQEEAGVVPTVPEKRDDEQCRFCSRYFAYDKIADHEESCPFNR